MIEFRKVNINDADELARIRSIFLLEANDVDSEEMRLEIEKANRYYFQNALNDNSFLAWVAIDGENIVATSGLTFSFVPPSFKCPDGKVAYIMNMFTFRNYRKTGIGMELFKKIIEEAKTRGFKKITLNATDMGKPLYERYGFKDVNGDMEYYING